MNSHEITKLGGIWAFVGGMTLANFTIIVQATSYTLASIYTLLLLGDWIYKKIKGKQNVS